MTKTITQLIWYLERKWKYSWWSCHPHYGSGRASAAATKVATLLVLVLFLWLVYISVWAATVDISSSSPSGLAFVDSNELPTFPATGSAIAQHQSTESEAIPFKTMISYETSSLPRGGNSNGSFITLSLPQFTRLERIFYRADTNRDGFLTQTELANYINQAVKDHLANAMKYNYQKYSQLDNDPRNGLVTWKEYVTHYFKKIGIPAITLDDVRDKSPAFTRLPKDFKVEIARLEASWSESANNSPDFVTVDEFLSLEHPEASPTRLLTLVTDVFSTFDLDGDGIIEKSEFETTYREAEGVDKVYKEDFHLIDTDNNEKITRLELMKYIDPRNIHHSQKDAKQILDVTDLDKDARMSLHEAIICGSYLIRSKLYDVVYRLHNPE
ncbi:unnamed protein product [Orchesella dallaii]|uniref:EF-hand domain-containing protein n=1 Tax=Orchesella dallaii TaxID=48710 RepID=A0ABP1S8W8_9HEXA